MTECLYYCPACGDCLKCFADDPCYDGDDPDGDGGRHDFSELPKPWTELTNPDGGSTVPIYREPLSPLPDAGNASTESRQSDG